ncbi:unnamed protein product [Calypogeia fissa]
MFEEGDQGRQRDGDAVRQYYIAVDRAQFKMGTLVELLAVLGRRDGLPLVICCSSRDSLDAVCATVAGSGQFFVSILHSDLEESERTTSLETFRLSMSEWNYFNVERSSVEQPEAGLRPGKSQVLVMTDVCLPSHALGETPLPARIMINFDIPSKKESYSRRMAACLGSPLAVPSTGSVNNSGGGPSGFIGGKMVINMVVGGEVSALRSLEESSGIVIDEMPINISELV